MAWIVPYVIMTAISVAVAYVMASMQKPIQGATLGDIAAQTAKEGDPRLIVWGIVRPIGGNVIACSDPKNVTTSSGGKGGGGGQTTESVYRTYAIGICEGPITGIRRVWRNNKLVYDARGNDWGTTNNPIFLQKAKFYLGDFQQLPDPSLEAIFGVGNVPAHRGTCYMVMDNENLTELGGALPQFIFEVTKKEGSYLTSKPYVIEDSDNLYTTGNNVISGNFHLGLLTYNNYIPEELQSGNRNVTSGIFRVGLITYNNYIPEELNTTGNNVIGGNFGH